MPLARRTCTRGQPHAAAGLLLGLLAPWPVAAALAAGPSASSPRDAPPTAEPSGARPKTREGPAPPPASAPLPAPAEAEPRLSERRPRRRWSLGVEGVALQIPPLRPRVVDLDARYLGNTVTLGGVGALARLRLVPELALELAVRSGSVRYRSGGDLISQDLVLAELGALLFLARGDVGHFALDAGIGGLAHGIRYELEDGRVGAQLVGAFSVRVGADLELLLRRVAVTVSLRGHGIVTDTARTRALGPLFAGSAHREAPLPTFQTYLLGSAGLLYRF